MRSSSRTRLAVLHLVAIGTSRHAALPRNFGRKRGTADMETVGHGYYHDAPDPSATLTTRITRPLSNRVLVGTIVHPKPGANMRRRQFIGGLAAVAAISPAALAQAHMRRVGVLMNLNSDDAEGQSRLAAFLQSMQEQGWTVGRNLQFDIRWGGNDEGRHRRFATEFVGLAPDVILAVASQAVMELRRATRTIPIIFVGVADPVGAGFVDSLARPGGTITGFTQYEYGISAKWLELLKEIAPRITRAAVLRNPAIASGSGVLGALQAIAPLLGVELRPIDVRNGAEIERAVAAFARGANDGLIVTGGGSPVNRKLIVTLAARHRLPAVYPFRYYSAEGGLVSYGADLLTQFRQAATYIDRILKGEKPTDLPVQAATKYELVINLKTAKTLGLTVPPTLLARADEVIE
jgi:putative ABC transport system substrate-binding protein